MTKELFDKLHTELLPGDDRNAIAKAAIVLQQGGLVAFPTETVYGLGADALNVDAAAKIYAAKGRPSDNPLIVHIADVSAVNELAMSIPEKAVLLMEAFWPGPLTIILPKKDIVPDGTTGGLKTVAIRMPSHPTALALIRESGVYIAAPSANTSGRPSPTTAEHVVEDMAGRIDMILDGGAVGIGIESTIVDLTSDTPTILRPGFITKAMLEDIVGEVDIDPSLTQPDPNLRPKAPGMKYTHYAPKGELTIVEASSPEISNKKAIEYPVDEFLFQNEQSVIDKINELVAEKKAAGYKVAVLTTEEHFDCFNCDNVIVVGEATKGQTISARLYAALRQCDELGMEYIYTEAFDKNELSGAIMNRLLKAAGHRVIQV